VSFELVALRLYDDVTQLLFLPHPVHEVDDAPTSFQVLRIVAAADTRVAEVGAHALGAHHRHARRLKVVTVDAHTGTAGTAVHRHRGRAIETVERPNVGTVQLADDLVTRRRTGHPTPARTAHRCRQINGLLPATTVDSEPVGTAGLTLSDLLLQRET